MTGHYDVTLHVPADLYQAVTDAARVRSRSLHEHLETVLRQSVQAPNPDRKVFSLTPTQDKLHRFLCAYQERRTGCSPSFEEMRDGMGVKSKGNIHRLLQALEERGIIRRLRARARAIEILVKPA